MGCNNSKNQNKRNNPNQSLIKNLEKEEVEYKIVLLGDATVGKSSIAQRFCKDVFEEVYEVTIGGAYL